MRAALHRHGNGEPLDLGDMPYRIQRAIVAARHGCRPGEVDDWPADEFYDALHVVGVA